MTKKTINLHDKIEELCSKYPINKCLMSDEELSVYHQGIHLGATKIAEYLNEQKSLEWGEEDEDMLNSCISSIEEAKENRYAYKETDGDTSYDHEIAWLKSLRPQSKKELSIEKAIQWLDDTFYFLNNSSGRGRDCEITTHDFDSLEEMYDSFRKAVTVDSEPSWKPSEEQMKRLLNIEGFLRTHQCGDKAQVIADLYEQLKK